MISEPKDSIYREIGGKTIGKDASRIVEHGIYDTGNAEDVMVFNDREIPVDDEDARYRDNSEDDE